MALASRSRKRSMTMNCIEYLYLIPVVTKNDRHPEARAKRASKDDPEGVRPSRLALRASASG